MVSVSKTDSGKTYRAVSVLLYSVCGLRLSVWEFRTRTLNESTVILEYINEYVCILSESNKGPSLLPPITNPSAKRSHLTTFKDARALVRLQSDHINRSVVPAFYRFLQAQDLDAQISAGKEYHASIETLVGLFERMEKEVDPAKNGVTGEGEKKALTSGLGLWIDGNEDLGWVDVMVGPWLYRSKNVLKHYRGFELPPGTKFNKWLDRLFQHPYFRRTCSTDDLYLDSYERYAFNRPNTSQVANAINSGRGLP
ncbi:hypothetical protein D9757_012188 [Collybiopsis confluens]|uniref:Glutathione S-transferase n=1 Tax=Collybiopsis confluens TaxID=2823264 RepID=A0A8H5LRA6_9AGAR|nr:hypothetical protein D9757_012188 [Collybiopsis confluens]